jgi:hypothetical protein
MMNLVMSLLMRQLLNESQQLRKKFAWSLQTSISRYRVKKITITKDVMSETLMKASVMNTKALQNDEDIALMFIIIWLRNIKVTWFLMSRSRANHLVRWPPRELGLVSEVKRRGVY